MPSSTRLARRTAWAAATSGLVLAPTALRHASLTPTSDPLGLAGAALWEDATESQCLLAGEPGSFTAWWERRAG